MPENTQSYQVCEFTQKVNMLPNCFRAFFGLKKESKLLLQGDLNPATAGFRFKVIICAIIFTLLSSKAARAEDPIVIEGEYLVLTEDDEDDTNEIVKVEGLIAKKRIAKRKKLRQQLNLVSLDGDTIRDRKKRKRANYKSEKHVVDCAALLKKMRAKRALRCEPNYLLSTFGTPNDVSYSSQYGLSKIKAPIAWDATTGSSDIIVAVIDTGIDLDHPDLVNNLWVNPGEIANNGIDDDANGYIDDVYGWNFYAGTSNSDDDNNHGTHVAGIVGAEGNNSIGTSGVNWQVRLMPLKFLGASGDGSTSDAVDAIEYAIANGARIINASWGGSGYSQALKDSISDANTAGILFVAAAGNSATNNDSSATYPANYDLRNIISVAATDEDNGLAYFSNYGKTTVDIGAPGDEILSTVAAGGYASYSGTSMAAPMVAGAAALLLSHTPSLTVSELADRLLNNTTALAALTNKTRKGLLNLEAALANEGSDEDEGVGDLSITLRGTVKNRNNKFKRKSEEKGYYRKQLSANFSGGEGQTITAKLVFSTGDECVLPSFVQVIGGESILKTTLYAPATASSVYIEVSGYGSAASQSIAVVKNANNRDATAACDLLRAGFSVTAK